MWWENYIRNRLASNAVIYNTSPHVLNSDVSIKKHKQLIEFLLSL